MPDLGRPRCAGPRPPDHAYRRVSARLSEALHAVGWMAIPGTAGRPWTDRSRAGKAPASTVPLTCWSADLLASTRRSVIRFKMRGSCDPAVKGFAGWQATGDTGAYEWGDHLDVVRAAAARGVTISRVRVVSEYLRWEHACTDVNISAGEDVRWLPRTKAVGLLLPGADCWVSGHRVVRWNFQRGDGTNPRHCTFSSDPHTHPQHRRGVRDGMGPGDTARGVQDRSESGRRFTGSGPRLRRALAALRGQARGWSHSSGYHGPHVSTGTARA